MHITALRSIMGHDMAARELASHGIRGMVQRWLRGRPIGLAEIYLPYRLYELTFQDHRRQRTFYYAVDAASGTLDPYEFPAPPPPEFLVEVETRNSHPAQIDEKQTRDRAMQAARRAIFNGGFFRVNHPSITANLLRSELYFPYWVAFFSTASHAGDPSPEQLLKLMVINSVRLSHEGDKVRKVLEAWLLGIA